MRHWWLGLVCVGLLACKDSEGGDDDGGGDGTETGGSSDTDLPSPYADESSETGMESPTMEADEVIEAALAGITQYVNLEPDAVMEAYRSLAQFDETCPEELTTYDEGEVTVTYWYTEGCETAAGLQVQGSGRYEITSYEEDGVTPAGGTLSADGGSFTLSAADGTWLQYSGYLGFDRVVTPEGNQSYFEFSGTVSADAATAAASPLMDGSVSVSGSLFSFAAGPLKALGGSGSLSGPTLGDARAFQFADLLIVPTECASEPVGTVSVRDDAGFWHDVVFDAADYDPESGEDPVYDPAKCDGCGSYLAAGEVLGDACVTESDINGFMNWEEFPW